MKKNSIKYKATLKIANLSLLYSLLLTLTLSVITYWFFKQKKLETLDKVIFSTVNSLPIRLSKDFTSLLKTIQKETKLREVTIYNSNCEIILSSNLLASPDLCRDSSSNYLLHKYPWEGTQIKIGINFEYTFEAFIRENLSFIAFMSLTYFLITGAILGLYTKQIIIAPINRFRQDLEQNNESEAFFEFDFIGKKLKGLQEKILSIEKERTLFTVARTIVHDIRNPLAYIRIMASQNELSNSELIQQLDKIDHQVNSLLGSKKPSFHLINPYFLLNSLKEELQRLFCVNVTIQTNLRSKDLISLNFHEFDLKNIISNLAKNSQEAGATDLKIDLELIEHNLLILFQDNGKGISSTLRDLLFTENFTTKASGNGIGLHSIKRFLNLHNSDITLESSDNSGTIFKIQSSVSIFPNNVVLIDDDKYLRLAWTKTAQLKQISFSSFASIEDFRSSNTAPDNSPLIFIDSNLGDNIKGEVEAENLFNQGFKNIIISTSDSLLKCNYPYIKAIIPKSAPFA